MSMTSSRPYIIRALYDWIVENDCTPYLLVDAHAPGVEVPQQFVNENGQIILNVAPSAVVDLNISNECISFSARFSGLPVEIFVPATGVLGIYARENGQGMMFETDINPDPDPEPPSSDEPKKTPFKRPALKVVK